MNRSTRTLRTLVSSIALAAALSWPAAVRAQSLLTSGITAATTGTLTTRLCGPVTPAVLSQSMSVPPAGSRLSCTNDLQCTGVGEACTFPIGSTVGSCSASGHLVREGLHYVAGNQVDVEVVVPACTNVTDFLMGGRSLTGSGIDAQATPGSFSRISSVSTTVNGQAALRQRFRVQFTSFGDGQSTQLQARVTAVAGGVFLDGPPITIVSVAAVNAAMRTTAAETGMRNGFVTSLYEKFGDYGQYFASDGTRAYGVNWSEQSSFVDAHGIHFRGSDMRIYEGHVAFSTQFRAEKPGCNPSVAVDGAFTLVPSSDGVDMRWIIAPRAEVNATGVCAVLSLGIWDLVTDGLADEQSIADQFSDSISAGFRADENGHIQVCENCRVVDVRIGGGAIEIWTLPPTDRIRVHVSAHDTVDRTTDPGSGLLLPAGMLAPIVGGGRIDTCQAANGTSPTTCAPRFGVDGDGLFNWWGSDVPVPSPIACNEYGVCAVLGGRSQAWARLLGVTRDVTKLPDARYPVGSLIARRASPSGLVTMPKARVTDGCRMPESATQAYRVALDVNDVATPVTGAPPSRGRYQATVLLAATADQSRVMFESRPLCPGALAPTSFPSTGTVLAR